MLFKLHLSLALALGIAAVSPAHASPVDWTVSGTLQTINVTGSFTYDATLNKYTNVAITAGAFSYDTSDLSPIPFGVDSTGLELIDGYVSGNNSGKSSLNLDFLSALTNAGGTIGLVTGFPTFQGTCGSADCSSGAINFTGTGGSVTTATVPEPATLGLVGTALLALWLGRRKQA